MKISVNFYSYFKDLTGSEQTAEELPDGSSISELLKKIFLRFPKLTAMEKAMLIAVGVDYQPRDHKLKNGDEVSLFPPVQGG